MAGGLKSLVMDRSVQTAAWDTVDRKGMIAESESSVGSFLHNPVALFLVVRFWHHNLVNWKELALEGTSVVQNSWIVGFVVGMWEVIEQDGTATEVNVHSLGVADPTRSDHWLEGEDHRRDSYHLRRRTGKGMEELRVVSYLKARDNHCMEQTIEAGLA